MSYTSVMCAECHRLRVAISEADQLLAGMWSYCEDPPYNDMDTWVTRASKVLRAALDQERIT
jgi:hypothetical protein